MKKQLELMWNYNYWANNRLLARAASLTPAQVSEKAPYMWNSILDTMTHVFGAEWVWRKRTQEGVSPTALLDGEKLSTLEQLVARWAEEEASMRAYITSLRDSDFEQVIEYKNTAGKVFRRPLWQILTHIVNHGTQHRSEVALSLTNFDRSPGDMDITVYLTELDA